MMKYTSFHEQRFRSSVSRAMKQIQSILDTTRQPRLAEDCDHTYDDKYALAEFLTNTSIAAQMNALERFGLDPERIMQVMGWVHENKETVTMRFVAEDTCTFLMEQDVAMDTGITREVETKTSSTPTSGTYFGSTNKTETVKTKVVTKVKEFHWKISVQYKFIIFPGTHIDQAIPLQKRATETVIVTAGGTGTAGAANQHQPRLLSPLPERTIHAPVDVNLTWFFQMLSPKEQTCQFSINREAIDTCRTPRRNDEIKAATEFYKQLSRWSNQVQTYFTKRVEKEIQARHNPVQNKVNQQQQQQHGILGPGETGIMQGLLKEPTFNGKHVRIVEYNKETNRYRAEPVDANSGLPGTLSIKPVNIVPDNPPSVPLATITDETILCPIVPLLEKESVLDMGDVGDFLVEQSRTIDEMMDSLSKQFPPRQLVKLISVMEATIVVMCKHVESLALQYLDSVDYIEHLLKQQLVAAVGKEVSSKDLDQFMRFHNSKLYGPQYKPAPFSYAIRRPGFYPDGILTIEGVKSSSSSKAEPVETFVRGVPKGHSMYIPLDASTSVEITGERYLHGWMQHRFKSKQKPEFNLACRARQFSTFIVIVGTMAGPDKFEPKDAIILQNKDEVLIPLLTSVLPSAKEFKDAIASLSPEQQEFAKAFRGMQLESSVFGVCVVQIKPQLEKLLGLPDCALTKEIQLTQDLLQLFVEYQIPSDLLSFDAVTSTGGATANVEDKIAAVKGYVKQVMDVIESSKEKQLKEEEMKADMRTEMQHKDGDTAPAVEDEMPTFRDEMQGSMNMEVNMEEGSESSSRQKQKHRRLVQKAASRSMTRATPPQSPGGPRLSLRAAQPMMFSAPMPIAATAAIPQAFQATIADASSDHQKMTPRRKSDSKRSLLQLSDHEKKEIASMALEKASVLQEDFTLLPKLLDAKLEQYDTEGALRSTIVKAGPNWTRLRQANLLVAAKQSTLSQTDVESEKKKAFDLLDAISRSGTLPIDCAELHVIVAVSHCFDNDVMGTVIQDNMNPIEKLERSSLLIASAVNGEASPVKLLSDEGTVKRLTGQFPRLFGEESSESKPVRKQGQRFLVD